MSDETTLLPCPFCGGEAYFDNDNDVWECVIMAHHEEWCPVSDWPKPPYDRKSVVVGDLDCCSDDREKAIAAWNARATGGTLTAEQVSKAVYAHSIHADCADADWQAIADELNAELGSEREAKLIRAMEDVLRYSTDTVWVSEIETLVDRMVSLGVYGHDVYEGARPWEVD